MRLLSRTVEIAAGVALVGLGVTLWILQRIPYTPPRGEPYRGP